MKKSEMRMIGPAVLAARKMKAQVLGGRGVLPGSRLSVRDAGGAERYYVIKASSDRTLSFTRLENGRWRTLHAMDRVLAIVPADDGVHDVQVYEFVAKQLIKKFDEAWKMLTEAGRTIGPQMPIFISLDKNPKKSYGHAVANLKLISIWSRDLTRPQIRKLTSSEIDDSDDRFYDRVKREFADRFGIDVSKVEVEFRIRS